MLRDTLFVPERTSHALFVPPVRSRFIQAWAPAVEEIGIRWFRAVAGVTIIEASKQLFAGVPRRAEQRAHRRLIIPLPGGAPQMRRE